MPTDQEIDNWISSANESIAACNEVQQQAEEYERAKESFTKQNGFTPEKLAEDAKKVIEHIKQNGTAEEKAQLEQVEAEAKAKFEAEMSQLEAEAQARQPAASPPKASRKRMREMI